MMMTSVLNLKAGAQEDLEIRQVLMDTQAGIQTMGLVHQRPYQSGYFQEMAMKPYLESLIAHIRDSFEDEDSDIQIV